MTVTSAKAKGRAGENELAAIFGGKRMLLSGAAGGGDVTDCDPPYDGLLWEVKRRARLPAIATAPLAQAEYAARGLSYIPAVAYREDRGRWIVTMYAQDFRTFVDACYEVGQQSKVRALGRQLEAIARELRGVT